MRAESGKGVPYGCFFFPPFISLMAPAYTLLCLTQEKHIRTVVSSDFPWLPHTQTYRQHAHGTLLHEHWVLQIMALELTHKLPESPALTRVGSDNGFPLLGHCSILATLVAALVTGKLTLDSG